MTLSATHAELEVWMKDVAEQENIIDFKLQTSGNSEKGDGYMGDVVFVTLTGNTKNSEPKVLQLVVKHGKKSVMLRESMNVAIVFLNEILLYKKIFPAYQQFQRDRKAKQMFDSFPKYYTSIVENSMEVIILDNMKKQGYDLHNRLETMNLKHVKLVLEQYGRFHGISLAMKDQEREKYLEITSSVKNILKELKEIDEFYKNSKVMFEKACVILRDNDYGEISNEIEPILEYVPDILTSLSDDIDDPYSVMVHGDCWNNNFMFLYKDEDHQDPEKVCILDWQISRIASPAIDLSYFLFANCSTEELANIDNLLHIYYKSLSECVLELGSDPEKVLPFSKLMEHWEEYSMFGVLMAPSILRVSLANKDEAPDIAQSLEQGKSMADSFLFEVKDQELFKKRLLKVMTNPTFINSLSSSRLS